MYLCKVTRWGECGLWSGSDLTMGVAVCWAQSTSEEKEFQTNPGCDTQSTTFMHRYTHVLTEHLNRVTVKNILTPNLILKGEFGLDVMHTITLIKTASPDLDQRFDSVSIICVYISTWEVDMWKYSLSQFLSQVMGLNWDPTRVLFMVLISVVSQCRGCTKGRNYNHTFQNRFLQILWFIFIECNGITYIF